jgi:membrane-bound metal-dependent hydrolase YbcI (DUF457 family)
VLKARRRREHRRGWIAEIMPSPIAHLGVGYVIHRYYKNKLPQEQHKGSNISLQLIMVSGLSMLPDLDVVPALVFRNMRGYHNNISHSLLFAVPVALLVAVVLQQIYRSNVWRSNVWSWFVICLVSYDLHIFMDALTAERGVMMFWPLTETRVASSVKVFYGLQWGLGWFSPWHLWTIVTESLFVTAVILTVNYFSTRRRISREIQDIASKNAEA